MSRFTSFELQHALNTLKSTYTDTPGAGALVCREGKLQYMGRSSFVQVETDLTNSLPDFALANRDADRVIQWLGLHDGQTYVEKRATTVVFSMGHSDVLSVPLSKLFSLYDRADEVVLQPTVNHDYGFTVTRYEWETANEALACLVDRRDGGFAQTHLSVNGTTIVLALGTGHGMAKHTFANVLDSKHPNQSWEGVFASEALSIKFPKNLGNDVKVTYGDNSNKSISPLLVKYEGLVTQVLSPIWK